jgi:hypothetical protein
VLYWGKAGFKEVRRWKAELWSWNLKLLLSASPAVLLTLFPFWLPPSFFRLLLSFFSTEQKLFVRGLISTLAGNTDSPCQLSDLIWWDALRGPSWKEPLR